MTVVFREYKFYSGMHNFLFISYPSTFFFNIILPTISSGELHCQDKELSRPDKSSTY